MKPENAAQIGSLPVGVYCVTDYEQIFQVTGHSTRQRVGAELPGGDIIYTTRETWIEPRTKNCHPRISPRTGRPYPAQPWPSETIVYPIVS